MKEITTKPDISIREAMRLVSKMGEKCLVIIDENNLVLGTLSDGDLRNAILKGKGGNDCISGIYQTQPAVLVEGQFSTMDVERLFTNNKFDLIPVVNKEGKLQREEEIHE